MRRIPSSINETEGIYKEMSLSIKSSSTEGGYSDWRYDFSMALARAGATNSKSQTEQDSAVVSPSSSNR